VTAEADISWQRLAVEGLAIVLSILLAFGIDAWWEERHERDEVKEALAVVEQELTANRAWVDFQRKRIQGIMDAVLRVYAVEPDINAPGSNATLDRDLVQAVMLPGQQPLSIASIDALLQSGKLHAIHNAELRLELVQWPLRVVGASSLFESDAYPEVAQRLAQHGDRAQLEQYLQLPGHPGIALEKFPLAAEHGVNHARVLADPVFRNGLVKKWGYLSDTLSGLDRLEADLLRTNQLIRLELAD
jgi:hypothetical protein